MTNLSKHKDQQEKIKQANERFKYKPLYIRLEHLHTVSKHTRFIFHSVSILTGFYFVYMLFNSIGFNQVLSAIVSAVLLVTFETIKSFLLQDCFNSYYKKLNFIIIGIFAVLFLTVSVYSSLNGAKQFHQNNTRKITYLQQQQKHQTDSVNLVFFLKNQELETKLSIYKKAVSWRGKIDIHNTATKQILTNIDNQIERNNNYKQIALSELKVQHRTELEQAQQDTRFNSRLIIIIACINESMILLLYWFLVYYDYSIIKEQELVEQFAPNYTFTVDQVKQLFTQHLLTTSSDNQLTVSDQNQQDKIGFKPVITLDSKEQTKKNLFNDFKNGVFDFRTLARKHHLNMLTIKKYKEEFKKL